MKILTHFQHFGDILCYIQFLDKLTGIEREQTIRTDRIIIFFKEFLLGNGPVYDLGY